MFPGKTNIIVASVHTSEGRALSSLARLAFLREERAVINFIPRKICGDFHRNGRGGRSARCVTSAFEILTGRSGRNTGAKMTDCVLKMGMVTW